MARSATPGASTFEAHGGTCYGLPRVEHQQKNRCKLRRWPRSLSLTRAVRPKQVYLSLSSASAKQARISLIKIGRLYVSQEKEQDSSPQPTKMCPKIPLCGDFFAAGQDFCLAICNPDTARAAIWQGNTYAYLTIALDGVRPLHNIIRKKCCHHLILFHWGRLGLGNKNKVPDCIANDFRVVFPSPDGNYMGHNDSYATSPLCHDEESSDTSSETRLQEEDNVIDEIDVPLAAYEEELVEESSDTSSETRIQEEDDVIVEIDAPVSAEEEELVVPEMEETVFVVLT
jgi:hypothetical protein